MPAWAVLVALLSVAGPVDPALLSPGPQELILALERTDDLLGRAETLGRTLARIHNRWAELAATDRLGSPCDDAEARSLVARARVLGTAYRNAVQSARAQGRRLERLLIAPTVIPILDAQASRTAESFRSKIAAEVKIWFELQAYHHRYLESVVRRCASSIRLEPVSGIPDRTPCTNQDCRKAVAVIGLAGGRICPGDRAADGTVVIVPDGRACYGGATCACVPVTVLPGSVLGP